MQAGRHAAETLGGQLDLSGLPREAQGVDALHATYVGQAFAQLGVFADTDAWLDVEACLARGGVPARHRDLLGRLLRDLASAGALDARRIDGRPHYRNLRPRRCRTRSRGSRPCAPSATDSLPRWWSAPAPASPTC